MSELAERFEMLVETFARKIAALAVDAAEQKGRADKAEAEVERLQREYVPGCPVDRDASVDVPVLDDERKQLCDEINKWKSRYFRIAALETELAEAQAITFDREEHARELRGACDEKQEAIEQLQHDLSQERAAHERMKAELAEWKLRAEVAEKQWNRVLDVEAERDAALADAAAIRKRIHRVAEILPQLQSSFIHGETGSISKLIATLVIVIDGGEI